MKCEEITSMLTSYLANEVTPSEKKLIQAHLATCSSCQNELAALSALQSRIRQSLHSLANQASPSPHALSRMQTRLAAEAPRSPAAHNNGPSTKLNKTIEKLRKGFSQMKRPAFAAAALLIVLIGTAAVVPGVRAQVIETVENLLGFQFNFPNSEGSLSWGSKFDFTPYNPTYMPDGLDPKGSMVGGDETADTVGLCYQKENSISGHPFIIVLQRLTDDNTSLPEGEVVNLSGEEAVLDTTSGEIEWCLYPHTYENSPYPIGEPVDPQVSDPNDFAKPTHYPVIYEGVPRLTLLKGDVKIEIFGTYPEEELVKVAKSLEEAEPADLPMPQE